MCQCRRWHWHLCLIWFSVVILSLLFIFFPLPSPLLPFLLPYYRSRFTKIGVPFPNTKDLLVRLKKQQMTQTSLDNPAVANGDVWYRQQVRWSLTIIDNKFVAYFGCEWSRVGNYGNRLWNIFITLKTLILRFYFDWQKCFFLYLKSQIYHFLSLY